MTVLLSTVRILCNYFNPYQYKIRALYSARTEPKYKKMSESARKIQRTLLCSILLISESRFDGVFERFPSGFAIEISSELERSEILCEAVF